MLRNLTLVTCCVWLMAGCKVSPESTTLPATGSCSLGLAPTVDASEAIQTILMAEGKLVVEQEIDALMNLWGEDATIINAKNTPAIPDDDQAWLGKDAIRHRYVRTVFPGAPTQADPKDLQIQILRDQAIVTATTHIGAEVSPAGDRWVLVRQNGCWLLENLTYNLEPK